MIKVILTKVGFAKQSAGFGGSGRWRRILEFGGCRSPTRAHGISAMHFDIEVLSNVITMQIVRGKWCCKRFEESVRLCEGTVKDANEIGDVTQTAPSLSGADTTRSSRHSRVTLNRWSN